MANPFAITLHASAAEAASGSGSSVDGTLNDDAESTYPRGAAKLLLEVTAVSGTDPTLDVVIETSPSGSAWEQVGAFAQETATGHQRLVVAGLERYIRVSWTIGGTDSPSFTFAVSGYAHTVLATPADLQDVGIPTTAFSDVSAGQLAKFLLASSDKVLSYVNAAHELPLTAWGDDLVRATAIVTVYDLLTFVGYRPGDYDDGFRARYVDLVGDTQKRGWLEHVAAGEITPIGVVDATPDTFDGGAYVESDTARGW